MLCDAMCIPAVVVISILFLHSKFKWTHYLAVFLCLFGLAIMIVVDGIKGANEGTHRIVGDVMALAAACLYAISNICQEILVKEDNPVRIEIYDNV
jgi:solute carrier family 35 protein F1/2